VGKIEVSTTSPWKILLIHSAPDSIFRVVLDLEEAEELVKELLRMIAEVRELKRQMEDSRDPEEEWRSKLVMIAATVMGAV